MNKLTEEQIKTLEDAFASYPEDYSVIPKYFTMEGIQEQLDSLEDGNESIFYITNVKLIEEVGVDRFSINRIRVGNDIIPQPNE